MNAERRTYKSVRVPAIRGIASFRRVPPPLRAIRRHCNACISDYGTLASGLSCLSSPVWTYNKTVIRVMHGWCHAVNFQVGSMHFPVIQRIITFDFSRAISMFTRRRFSLRSKLFRRRSEVRCADECQRRRAHSRCKWALRRCCSENPSCDKSTTRTTASPSIEKFLHDSCRACWSSLCQVPGHISVIH